MSFGPWLIGLETCTLEVLFPAEFPAAHRKGSSRGYGNLWEVYTLKTIHFSWKVQNTTSNQLHIKTVTQSQSFVLLNKMCIYKYEILQY